MKAVLFFTLLLGLATPGTGHGVSPEIPVPPNTVIAPPADIAQLSAPFDTPFSVGFVVGIGTPVGFAGIEFGYHLNEHLETVVGAGWGSGGMQWSAMGRWHVRGPGSFFGYLGAGGSMGEILDYPDQHPDQERFTITRAWFVNTELGFGWRTKEGLILRWVLGMATLLNPEDATCIDNCMLTSAGGTQVPTPEKADFYRTTPYIGLVLGFAF